MTALYDFHPEARIDLREITDFIADDNPDAADKVLTEILDTLASLVRFPHQGHRRTDLTSRPLCFWRVYDYLIAYAPDERPLWLWQSCTATAALALWPRFCGAGKINRKSKVNSWAHPS
jgi:plasmid stabilization system protein ParE